MPIVYKQHLDERDGTIYNCVLMPDGKWWAAENLRWAGAGMAYSTQQYTDAFGRMYDWASASSGVPAGTHLPTNDEWLALQAAVQDPDGKNLKAIDPLWRGLPNNDLYGFRAMLGGIHFGSLSNPVSEIMDSCYFWTATAGTSANVKNLVQGSDAIFEATRPPNDYRLSVRFIVDVFNEPIPPTKIHGTFSGSGVKVFAAMPSDTTFEVPLSAQSTTELTISKDFITTFGPFIGRVRILVVDGEYISEWKDWDFRI